MKNPSFLRAFALLVLLAPLGAAQTPLTIRERIVPVPPFSICIDGATHMGECSGLRLRPDPNQPLTPYVGAAIEITGDLVRVTCETLRVQSVQPITEEQLSRTTTGATLTVDFFGASAGDTYVLFLDVGPVAGHAFQVPGITGPFHLDLSSALYLGAFAAQGLATPYASFSTPSMPNLLGVNFYDQAVVVDPNLNLSTSNLDCFSF